MPIYEYRCRECGFQNDYLQKISEPPMSVCPSCGKEAFQKQLTAAGFQLKGSGWYATDFRNPGKPESKSAKSDSGASAGETAGSGGDAKPAPEASGSKTTATASGDKKGAAGTDAKTSTASAAGDGGSKS